MRKGKEAKIEPGGKEKGPNDLMNQLFVFTTTSTYTTAVQRVSTLLRSGQNVQECAATAAR